MQSQQHSSRARERRPNAALPRRRERHGQDSMRSEEVVLLKPLDARSAAAMWSGGSEPDPRRGTKGVRRDDDEDGNDGCNDGCPKSIEQTEGKGRLWISQLYVGM